MRQQFIFNRRAQTLIEEYKLGTGGAGAAQLMAVQHSSHS